MRGAPTILLLLAPACGSDPAGQPPSAVDAGVGDGSPAGDDGPLLPAPEAPRLEDWPCPAGWLQEPVTAGDEVLVRACAPPPPVVCEGATAQLPGDEGCRAIGTPCPAAEDELPDEEAVRALAPGFSGPVRWVHAQGRPRGDGSREAPFVTIAEALTASRESGAIVALGVGTWRERFDVSRPTAFVGACTAGTVVEHPGGDDEILQTIAFVEGGGGRLANLTVRGGRGVLAVRAPAPVVLSSVLVVDAVGTGVGVKDAELEAEELVVRGTRTDPNPAAPAPGSGLMVRNDARVTLRRSVLEDNRHSGVLAGILAPDLGTSPGPTVVLEDVAVRDTAPDLSGQAGCGVLADSGTDLTLTRCVVEGNATGGVVGHSYVASTPTTLRLRDVVVRHTWPSSARFLGAGVDASPHVRVELERVLLDENHDYGIIVAGEQDDSGEMPFDARDLVVRDTQPVSQAQGGLGIALGAGARLELRRAVLVGNHEHAIVAGSQGTATPAEVTLEDVVIAESHSVPAGDRGRGITASGGAQLTGTRVRVIRTHECAVAAIGWGGAPETRVSLSHLLVEDVLPATCAERPHEDPLSCAQPDGSHWGGGNGVAATGGARVTLEDFRIGGCRQAGLLVAKAARVTARRGVITDNELGINALVPGLEGSRLDEDVYTYGNRQDVASVDVPLPAASELIRH